MLLIILFSWLQSVWPACGPCRRWRDVVSVEFAGIADWFKVAQDCKTWRITSESAWRFALPTPEQPLM